MFEVEKDKLTIMVEDVIDNIESDNEGFKEEELGLLIIKSLMDDVTFTEQGINMTKFIE